MWNWRDELPEPDMEKVRQEVIEEAQGLVIKDPVTLILEALGEVEGVPEALLSAWHYDDVEKAGKVVLKAIDQYSRQYVCRYRNIKWSELEG